MTVRGGYTFLNDSWRPGGQVTQVLLHPKIPESAEWLPPALAYVENHSLDRHEQRYITFVVQSRLVERPTGVPYPRFEVEVRFLDNQGAYIRQQRNGEVLSLSVAGESRRSP